MKFIDRFKFSLPPLPTPPPAHSPSRHTLLLLSGLVAFAAFSHFLLGHPFVATYGVIIWAMKTISLVRVGHQPARWLVMLLTIASFVLVLVFYGGWNGQKAGISFLVLLASLKFLESNSLRDYYLVCLILFFLASSSFLFNSSILSIACVLIYTIFTLALMLRLSDPHRDSDFSPLKTAGSILLKAVPLAVLLFFFFPRIHGSFGFIPSQDELGGENQLDDALVAGDFANSAFSNEPAFRVEFEGEIPAKQNLYWRAKVMIDERNFAWEVRKPSTEELRSARALEPRTAPTESLINYQIVHEPSNDNFIPMLDYALNPETGIQLSDHSVYRLQKEANSFGYTGRAALRPTMLDSTINGQLANKQELLTTQSRPTARTLELLNQWQRNSASKRELVEQVLAYMRANNFIYSLSPPGLGNNPVDEFLFESKTGYCEHYASAFTIVMRWLQIPSRVVVGYQGGTANPAGEYLLIKYSDAHAWSEVWIDGSWIRVDPTTTAALGEQRISEGMEALLGLWGDSAWQNWERGASLANYLQPSGYERAMRTLRDTWDNAGYQWNKWVINYDFNAQKNLLAGLGLQHRNSLYTLLGLMTGGLLLIMLFYFWQLIPKVVKLAEEQQIYRQFLSKFKRLKLIKLPAETPLEFALRAKTKLPAKAEEIQQITDAYVNLRYGKDNHSIDAFKSAVKSFKPSTQSRSKDNEKTV